MKVIRINPLKRLVLVVSCLTLLAGCSGLQTNTLYKSWEQQAYSAYRMPVPAPQQASVLPALFRTVSASATPARPRVYPVVQARPISSAARVLAPPKPAPLPSRRPEKALDYIASFYGL